VLDEVDKLGADYRGDPSSALLEVLDPAQNHTFRDHYLEVELDLSKVLFIATANMIDTIPAPLLDRMEVIRLDGYTEEEKVAIARHHLVGRQLERAALREDEVTITDGALRAVVGDYTREAGVRSLERELGRLLRWEKSRLSQHLGRMQKRGLVSRDRCDTDQRGAVVTITPRGRDLITAAAPQHAANVRHVFIDQLTKAELKSLIAIGDKVRKRLAALENQTRTE